MNNCKIDRLQKILEAKIVILGDSGVGKTCLLTRYVENRFSNEGITIGATFTTKSLLFDNWKGYCRVRMLNNHLLVRQERFQSMLPMYFRGASCAIVCFDLTRENTFKSIKNWIKELNDSVESTSVITIIVGNKVDLKRQVNQEVGKQYASSINAFYFETSAKNNIGIDELFLNICKELISRNTLPNLNHEEETKTLKLENKSNRTCCK